MNFVKMKYNELEYLLAVLVVPGRELFPFLCVGYRKGAQFPTQALFLLRFVSDQAQLKPIFPLLILCSESGKYYNK